MPVLRECGGVYRAIKQHEGIVATAMTHQTLPHNSFTNFSQFISIRLTRSLHKHHVNLIVCQREAVQTGAELNKERKKVKRLRGHLD